MPLTLPDLDDRRFDDLVQEALALIPARAPEWTDHNASDPGITLVELFAWLSETLMYRINRVTPANTAAFLKLLNGPDWSPSADGDLAADARATVLEMRRCDRGVTAPDFETLTFAADPQIARVRCIPRRDLTTDPLADAPSHVSVVLLPTGGGPPSAKLLATVAAYLEPRRLITTRVHVTAPRSVDVSVSITLNLKSDALGPAVRAAALAALARYFDPLVGGDHGAGWPFGRPVYLSEVYRLFAGVAGVDFVSQTPGADELATPDASRLIRNAAGDLVGIGLQPDELPSLKVDPAALITVAPTRPKDGAVAPVPRPMGTGLI